MRRKKPKHFKQVKPIPVEIAGLPNKVRVGYKDIKIKYVRPDYKKWEWLIVSVNMTTDKIL